MPDKATLKAELVAILTTALEAARQAHAAAHEGATHAESRAENSKDTRGLEQSYLARGQAQRVADLEAGLASVTALALRTFTPTDAIAMSALVTLEADATHQHFFIAPHGGGTVLTGTLLTGIKVVTPDSPLGRSLLGKRVDDEVEFRQRTLVISSLH